MTQDAEGARNKIVISGFVRRDLVYNYKIMCTKRIDKEWAKIKNLQILSLEKDENWKREERTESTTKQNQ